MRPYPGTPLRIGSRGENVRLIQQYLNDLAGVIPGLAQITADGIFGPLTHNAVVVFQRFYRLTPDGIVGPLTWNRIMIERSNL